MKHDPLIEILKSELQRKKSRNRSYSLRSYSRDLAVDPSNLSKLLSRRKEIGPRLRKKLGKKLGFEPQDLESWLLPTKSEKTADGDYSVHDFHSFKIISGWQHYAILELFKLRGFDGTAQAVSDCLGLKLDNARDSLQRLKEAGLIKYDGVTKRLRPVDDSSTSILNFATSKAHRDQQQQILEGAIDALETTPIQARSQTSMTMAVDSRKLDAAKELIKKFRREMGRLLSNSEQLDGVYQLSISLYPVTKSLKLRKGSQTGERS